MDIQELKFKCIELALLSNSVINNQKKAIDVADEYFNFIVKQDKNIIINIGEIKGILSDVLLEVIEDVKKLQ